MLPDVVGSSIASRPRALPLLFHSHIALSMSLAAALMVRVPDFSWGLSTLLLLGWLAIFLLSIALLLGKIPQGGRKRLFTRR